MLGRRALLSVYLLSAFGAAPALAQRTGDNAVTSAGDAFGKSVGSDRIGLYSTEDVRGFSPVEAGNARIEGLYFVQADRPNIRNVEGNTIRVGITAQGYPFPAPTGIVDYRLVLPGKETVVSSNMAYGSLGPRYFNTEAKFKVNDTTGFYVGAGFGKPRSAEGDSNGLASFGTAISWKPRPGALVAAFIGHGGQWSDEAAPIYFPSGVTLPPQIKRGKARSQPWSDKSTRATLGGMVIKWPMGGWKVETGLFYHRKTTNSIYADLYRDVRSDGSFASHTIVADGDNLDDIISGEFRVLRQFGSGDVRHTITASARGRRLNRAFGGVQRIALGSGTSGAILTRDARAKPAITLGTNDDDKVRQMTLGLAYGLEWKGVGGLDVSLSKSRYRKHVDFAAAGIADLRVADDPWLGSFAGHLGLTKKLTAYGGYVRGLEEAVIAPDIAINRSEAPPAIRTSQWDAGVRYAITPKMTLVAGVFSVRKPYFNIDTGLRFRQLGTISNKGIELSLSGSLKPGLTLVGGTLLLDPKVAGTEVTAGRIGERPVGSVRRRSILNLDWRPKGGTSNWSFDTAFESLSARTANATNTLTAPARETLNLSTRYRFKLGTTKAVLRAQVQNVFGDYGWQVSQSGGFTYSPPRIFSLELTVDY